MVPNPARGGGRSPPGRTTGERRAGARSGVRSSRLSLMFTGPAKKRLPVVVFQKKGRSHDDRLRSRRELNSAPAEAHDDPGPAHDGLTTLG